MIQHRGPRRRRLIISGIMLLAAVIVAALVSNAGAATNDQTSAVVPKLMNTPATTTLTMPDASFDGSGTYLYGSTTEGSYLGDYTSHISPEQALKMAGLPAMPSYQDADPRPAYGSYSVTPMTTSTLTNAVNASKLAGCTADCQPEYVGVLLGQDPFANVSELTATSGTQTMNYSQGTWHATLDQHTTGWSVGGTISMEGGVGENAPVDASGNGEASFGYYSESTTGYEVTNTETQSPTITVQAGHTGWIDAVYNYASYVGYYVLNSYGAGTVLIP
ncbi:MAG TPA: hypothetical protein VK816_08790, partial [Jatrophihabitantaceae bacterium]|nr:hypothetical protein [Jatrophihabitantaceae bacterium]